MKMMSMPLNYLSKTMKKTRITSGRRQRSGAENRKSRTVSSHLHNSITHASAADNHFRYLYLKHTGSWKDP